MPVRDTDSRPFVDSITSYLAIAGFVNCLCPTGGFDDVCDVSHASIFTELNSNLQARNSLTLNFFQIYCVRHDMG